MKWFEDIFTKSKLMIVSGVLGVLSCLFLAVYGFITHFDGYVNYAMLAILSAALLICYKKGETSAQKALAGAVLAVLVQFYSLCVFGGAYRSEAPLTFVVIAECLEAVGYIVIFLNHILLQIDHKGDKAVIRVNQLVLVFTLAVQLAEFIVQLSDRNNIYIMKLHAFSFFCLAAMITCMESRIQKYKARRFAGMENGTWTEEERRKCKKIFKF